MRAVIYDEFGSADVLEVAERPEPSVRSGHARIRVAAAALNPKDVLVRKGKMRWLTGTNFPRTPGYDFSGTLIDDAADLPAGTEVWGMVNSHQGGTCAEMISVPFGEFAARPESVTMAEAASVPLAGLTALQALRDELEVEPGDRVVLNGASGGVGTLAVQVGKALGAEVVAVCSARNHELVRDLGADEVVDYNVTDPLELRGVDHFFDIYGNKSWSGAKATLNRGGRYCTTVPSPTIAVRSLLSKIGLQRASLVVVKSRRADLELLGSWVDDGTLHPVVDRVLTLEESSDAHRYLETRRARGKVVLELD